MSINYYDAYVLGGQKAVRRKLYADMVFTGLVFGMVSLIMLLSAAFQVMSAFAAAYPMAASAIVITGVTAMSGIAAYFTLKGLYLVGKATVELATDCYQYIHSKIKQKEKPSINTNASNKSDETISLGKSQASITHYFDKLSADKSKANVASTMPESFNEANLTKSLRASLAMA